MRAASATQASNTLRSVSGRAAPPGSARRKAPPERRTAAAAHAARLSRSAGRIALELPIGADVDDFRRVLVAEAKP